MISKLPLPQQRIAYEREARRYLRSLPLEHFMESTAQATQRKITLESLDLVQARRSDVHVFSELLVQYPRPRQSKPGQVVPDNMVVITPEPIQARLSFNVPLEPTGPFWTLEYVSRHDKSKDYEATFRKYERGLKVPYYLVFDPAKQAMTLYRHNGRRYVTVKPNAHGRYEIPELDLEVAIHEEWVRFWFQGELLPLPADLQRDLDKALKQIDEARQQAEEQKKRADELQRRIEAAERELTELRRNRKNAKANKE